MTSETVVWLQEHIVVAHVRGRRAFVVEYAPFPIVLTRKIARRFVAPPLRICGIYQCHKREDCVSLFGAKCARKESPAILASLLVAFRGEDRFRIGAGNFAHCNPAKSADKCTD